MHGLRTPYAPPKTLLWRLLLLGTVLLAASWGLSADTPGRLQSTQAGGCYCHCSRAKSPGSCVKMCELPNYASPCCPTSSATSPTPYSTEIPTSTPLLRHT